MKVKEKKTKRVTKHKSISKLKDTVWPIFSEYIRKRDCLRTTGTLEWGRCITCGLPFKYSALQAGHFIPGRHNSILFEETCTHAQCYRCNVPMGGEPLKYRREIIRLYGEDYDLKLEEQAMETKKFTRDELIELKEQFQAKIKELEKEV